MPSRRSQVRRNQHRLTPELRPLAERLLVLMDDHMDAIQSDDDDHPFYSDGRHKELVELAPIVHQALGIKLWARDRRAILQDALKAA